MSSLANHLQLGDKERQQLEASIVNYRRHARLELRMDTVKGQEVWCTAHQEEPAVDGRLLSEGEILDRATEAFSPLLAAGYVPIIGVYTMEKGPPEKPVTKHRAAGDIELRNVKGSVLRQAPPRMLFTHDGDRLKLLAAEDIASMHFFEQLAAKAMAWWERAAFRKP